MTFTRDMGDALAYRGLFRPSGARGAAPLCYVDIAVGVRDLPFLRNRHHHFAITVRGRAAVRAQADRSNPLVSWWYSAVLSHCLAT